jgi:transcriptional regulator with XRE-family HTH domain
MQIMNAYVYKKYSDNISINVKKYRRLLNLSQENMAFLAEIDRTYASQIERGISNPSLKVLSSLSVVLKVTLEQLISEPNISNTTSKKKAHYPTKDTNQNYLIAESRRLKHNEELQSALNLKKY